MTYLYDVIFYRPLLNVLVLLYNTVAFRDLGIAIVFLTILVRIILFPLFQKSARHQSVMQRLQPKLRKIQEDHQRDKEKQVQATMELYRAHGVSPFSGFFLLLIQLPVLIALYGIFLKSFSPDLLSGLYSFVDVPAQINRYFLGLINLEKSSIVVVGLAAIAQYFQARLAIPRAEPGRTLSAAEKMSQRMALLGPLMTLLIFSRLPAAVSLYWVASSAFSILQQLIINRQLDHGEHGKPDGTIRKEDHRTRGVS